MASSGAVQGHRARVLPQPGVNTTFQPGRIAIVSAPAMNDKHAALAIGPCSFNELQHRLPGLPDGHAMQVEFPPNLESPGFQAVENALLNTRRFPGQNRTGTYCIHGNRSRPMATVFPARQALRGIASCLQLGVGHGPAAVANPVVQQRLYVGHRVPETGVGAGLRLLG